MSAQRSSRTTINLKERRLLLKRLFDGLILLKIERELGDEYCLKFNESGYDKDYNRFSEDEDAKRIVNLLIDESLLNICENIKTS